MLSFAGWRGAVFPSTKSSQLFGFPEGTAPGQTGIAQQSHSQMFVFFPPTSSPDLSVSLAQQVGSLILPRASPKQRLAEESVFIKIQPSITILPDGLV